jgi:hypothetical protein
MWQSPETKRLDVPEATSLSRRSIEPYLKVLQTVYNVNIIQVDEDVELEPGTGTNDLSRPLTWWVQ